jgi:energy-coupling factor transporter transmembrane protein EcfT
VVDKYFGSHEIKAREEVLKTSSDRSFGLFFAGFCVIVAALSIYRGGSHWPWWLAGAVVFAIVTFVQPHLLGPLNRLWTKFGLLLFTVISPVVLAILFYGCITPIGWLLQLAGKDLLRLRWDRDAESYWILRKPPGPPAESLKNQF